MLHGKEGAGAPGMAGRDRFDSSARFQDQPAYRASSAFNGRADPGWSAYEDFRGHLQR